MRRWPCQWFSDRDVSCGGAVQAAYRRQSLDLTIRISTESQRKNKLTTIIQRPRGRITQSCHLSKRQLPLKVCSSSGAVLTGSPDRFNCQKIIVSMLPTYYPPAKDLPNDQPAAFILNPRLHRLSLFSRCRDFSFGLPLCLFFLIVML